LDKAMNLAFYELIGDADLLNHEIAKYAKVTKEEIQKEAKELFDKDKSTTLYYLSK
jgi:zinc protease